MNEHPHDPGTAPPVDTEAPAGLGSLAGRAAVDEQGRLDPLASVGGVRGIVEASLPTFVFLVGHLVTQQVTAAGVAALAVAAVLSGVRLAQRQSPAQALAGLVVVGLSVVLALTRGEARDFYLWGFVTNFAYGIALPVSVLVGWPVLGLVLGMVHGEGLAWRDRPARRRAYALATWIVAAVSWVRLAVQVPLYLADAATALGVARVVMGLPLYALGLWLAWSVSVPARTSATGSDAVAGPGEEPRSG